MNIIKSIISLFISYDQLSAKYNHSKFYLKESIILLFKSGIVFAFCIIFFMFLFLLLNPHQTQKRFTPVFQVSKINQKSMLTIYVNNHVKKTVCHDKNMYEYENYYDNRDKQSLLELNKDPLLDPTKDKSKLKQYRGKYYSRQEYCQIQHILFPFQITRHNQIDVFLSGMNYNIQYITGCVIKLHQQNPVCQKFPFSQNIQIFNNLVLQNFYSIEIELKLRKQNQYYGDLQILFKQQNGFFAGLIKKYYLIIAVFASIILSIMGAGAYGIFQIAEILSKKDKQQEIVKSK